MQPTFNSMMQKDVIALFKYTLNDAFAEYDMDTKYVGDYNYILEQLIDEGLLMVYKHIVPPRSCGITFIRTKKKIQKKLIAKINYLKTVPQPEQRTQEWYEFRYTHLTASNIWKAFISDSTKNQLIYEKCQPLSKDKYSYVNLESPMHWGQKYESVSVKLYEQLYSTKIRDFGCIPHKTVEFLAASPDGINTLEGSARFGRMLEVKNIVNREINGIPKLEYWVQMQLQLEVCDLNECDFLETRFTEFPDVDAFNACTSTQKGMMMLFMKSNGQPLYEYGGVPPDPPSGMGNCISDCMGNCIGNCISVAARSGEDSSKGRGNCISGDCIGNCISVAARSGEDSSKGRGAWGGTPQWEEDMMEKNKGLTWIKNIYWKLDQLSCVLVLRNKLWFAAALPQLIEIWNIIEREKKTGYAHRAPKKAIKSNDVIKVKKLEPDANNIDMPAKCFITINA
jgi:putative phage-type endonuclease